MWSKLEPDGTGTIIATGLEAGDLATASDNVDIARQVFEQQQGATWNFTITDKDTGQVGTTRSWPPGTGPVSIRAAACRRDDATSTTSWIAPAGGSPRSATSRHCADSTTGSSTLPAGVIASSPTAPSNGSAASASATSPTHRDQVMCCHTQTTPCTNRQPR